MSKSKQQNRRMAEYKERRALRKAQAERRKRIQDLGSDDPRDFLDKDWVTIQSNILNRR